MKVHHCLKHRVKIKQWHILEAGSKEYNKDTLEWNNGMIEKPVNCVNIAS